jgi:type I restriction enzyme S subunit
MNQDTEDLPLGWETASIESIAQTATGGTPSRKQSPYYGGSIPWVKSGDLNDGVIVETSETITTEGLANSNAKIFPKGAVCVALYGATVGKLGILEINAATNQAVCGVFPEGGIESKFVFYSLRNERENLISQAQGGAQPNISNGIVKETILRIPPLNEQRRIVAKIEALQERSRKAREALAEVGPLLEQFRQSLLAAAFRGDLTADWRAANPNVEPASELLNRIRQERRRHWEESEQAKFEKKNTKPKNDKWREKYPESQPLKFDGELPAIPQTWEWTNWDSLTMWITYGFTRPMPHVDMGPMIVTAKNVRNEGLRLDVVDHTTEEAFAELNPKDLPVPGDILIIKDGATTGRAALVPDEIGEFCINQSVGVVWLKYSPMHRLFLLRWVQSPLIQKMIQEAMAGMAMPHLSVTDFKAMPVPIPPLEEQLAICEVLEFGLGTADSLRASTFESESELTQLDQSILAKAFRGELVPQDPNDEPASELLARIRRMRDAVEDQTNSKARKASKKTRKKSTSA